VSTKRDPHLSLGDVAYQAIREAISTNKMKPGDRLSEYMVADWLKISRTPAREGLRRLESEGLLTSHPRRGLVVSALDEGAVHELYAAREVLEGTVAAMAARFATDAEISSLQHMVEREATLMDQPELMFEHNQAFHALVAQAARNRYLVKFLQSIADTLSAHRRVSTMTDAQRRQEVLQQHRELVEAISRHDEEAARTAALRHIKGALRARLAVERGQPLAPAAAPAAARKRGRG
jgi:DNA-binding GntR family transcriptional regulator